LKWLWDPAIACASVGSHSWVEPPHAAIMVWPDGPGEVYNNPQSLLAANLQVLHWLCPSRHRPSWRRGVLCFLYEVGPAPLAFFGVTPSHTLDLGPRCAHVRAHFECLTPCVQRMLGQLLPTILW